MTRLRLVALGTGVALAVALPAALLAQVLEALRGDADGAGTGVTYVLAGFVLIAMALGGTAVGRRRPARPALLGAAAGLLAIVAVLAIGIARRIVADDDVAWATVPATTLVAMALAAGGSALGAHRAGRKPA